MTWILIQHNTNTEGKEIVRRGTAMRVPAVPHRLVALCRFPIRGGLA